MVAITDDFLVLHVARLVVPSFSRGVKVRLTVIQFPGLLFLLFLEMDITLDLLKSLSASFNYCDS